MTLIRKAPYQKGRLLGYFRRAEKIGKGSSRQGYNCSSTRSLSSSSSQPVVELREDALFPQYSKSYFEKVELSQNNSSVYPPRLCFLSRPELGGTLNVATHAYYFQDGLLELQEQRKQEAMSESENVLQSYIQTQQSSVYVEAPLVKELSNFVIGLANTTAGANSSSAKGNSEMNDLNKSGDDCILELRRYNLKLGYDTVPKFLELYGAGLPSKLEAPGTDPTTSLVTLLYSEVGRLNEVIEIWRHGNGVPAMEKSRAAARKAQEWRSAIASIADLAIEFRSTIHRPVLAFPPIK